MAYAGLVTTLAIEGYFHRQSWFWLKPWLLRISFSCRLHCSAQTCMHVFVVSAATKLLKL